MLYRSVLCTVALVSCGTANAIPIRQSPHGVEQVLVASDTDVQVIANNCNSGFADIPGAFVKITIPPGANQLLVARFTGELTVGQSGTLQSGGANKPPTTPSATEESLGRMFSSHTMQLPIT